MSIHEGLFGSVVVDMLTKCRLRVFVSGDLFLVSGPLSSSSLFLSPSYPVIHCMLASSYFVYLVLPPPISFHFLLSCLFLPPPVLAYFSCSSCLLLHVTSSVALASESK